MALFTSIVSFRDLICVDDSLNDKFISVAIRKAQFLYVQPLLGSFFITLNAKIEAETLSDSEKLFLDMLSPYLIFKSAQILTEELPYRLGNAGISTPQVPNSVIADPSKLSNYYSKLASKALTNLRDSVIADSFSDVIDGDLFIAIPSASIYTGGESGRHAPSTSFRRKI